MIHDFRCHETKGIWEGKISRKFPSTIQELARRKLRMLQNAKVVRDLLIPPGNRLESLKGKRKGQYNIRINDQWRICFRWNEGHVYGVEIIDYH